MYVVLNVVPFGPHCMYFHLMFLVAWLTLELVVRFKAWQMNSPASITFNRSTPCITNTNTTNSDQSQQTPGGAAAKETGKPELCVAEMLSV